MDTSKCGRSPACAPVSQSVSASSTLPGRILSVLRMGRPHFLVGGLLLHWLRVVMALSIGASLNLPALLWA